MIDVQKSIRPDLTMEEFRTALLDGGKTFPEIYLPEDKILQEYRHILQTIDNDMMPKFFSQFPEKFKSCVIQAVPKENQESAALASYMPGTPSKSGYFQVNMFLHKEKPIHQSIALTLHEANPGRNRISISPCRHTNHFINYIFRSSPPNHSVYGGQGLKDHSQTRPTHQFCRRVGALFRIFGRRNG